MSGAPRLNFLPALLWVLPLCGLLGCGARPPALKSAPPPVPAAVPPVAATESLPPVLLGIDVLEAEGFAAVKGKRIGLLTHPAGVNRRGISTIDVLRHAPGVQLVALFGVEHGINSEFTAGQNYSDYVDQRTGLPVRSLYDGKVTEGKSRRPTKAQLKDLDALVVDLQDIGTRSYTFVSAMRGALEACFENGKEIIVLDRPNPLGGLKVDGPPLDAALVSYVGAFRVPYVHGLTIGELARMAAQDVTMSEAVRARGKLTVVPMRGWTRAMRWPETGLPWVPTSGGIKDFAAVQGYPMVGLGCEPPSGFRSGFHSNGGDQHWFRALSHVTAKPDVVEKELRALKLHGLRFSRISVPSAKTGQPGSGLYVEIIDYDDWQPTELDFWLLKLACKLEPKNPFATAKLDSKSLFVRLVGSTAFVNDLVAKGKNIDVEAWLRTWREQARIYQQQSKRFWLYH